METKDGIPTLYASSTAEWRTWLNDNGKTEKSVWLIVYHKTSKTPSVHWHDAIEHALCFGWVDSKAMGRDNESCYLKFTPRNPKSKWGKKNELPRDKAPRYQMEFFISDPEGRGIKPLYD